jgi:hypothetical protein
MSDYEQEREEAEAIGEIRDHQRFVEMRANLSSALGEIAGETADSQVYGSRLQTWDQLARIKAQKGKLSPEEDHQRRLIEAELAVDLGSFGFVTLVNAWKLAAVRREEAKINEGIAYNHPI